MTDSPAAVRAALEALSANASSPLFDRFPSLRGRLPWLPLGTGPSPIEPLPALPDGESRLYAKRDDLLSPLYGGNKLRKLEHVLADALAQGCRTLITIGGLGSHQCLATALHGRKLGFDVDLVLFEQPMSGYVREVLRADLAAGARLHGGGSLAGAMIRARLLKRRRRLEGGRPYLIPIGATTALAGMGFLNAGLELAQQIESGAIPAPDRIYLAAGTAGSVAGLVAGLKLAGVRSRCVAVAVSSRLVVTGWRVRQLAQATLRLLRQLEPGVPEVRIEPGDVEIERGFLGRSYGAPTPEALIARAWAAPVLSVETTYTAKALAAMLTRAGTSGREEILLYWHTRAGTPPAGEVSLEALPPALLRQLRP